MTRVRQSAGFSFELSESAPPVRTEEHTPMGDLDLDLTDFGPGLSISSQAPEVAPGPAQPSCPSPFSPIVPEVARDPSPAAPSPSELADHEPELVLDWKAPPNPPAPPVAPQLGDAEPMATGETLEQRPEASAPRSGHTLQGIPAPRVKKIHFPQAAAPAAPSVPVRRIKKSATTRFSPSISQRPPDSAFIDPESEPEALAEHGAGQSPPEDLPSPVPPETRRAERRPATSGGTWSSETPTAREIWLSARRVWQMTSKHAVTFSGQGLKSAHKLARNVHHKLHMRLEESAERHRPRSADDPSSKPPTHSETSRLGASDARPASAAAMPTEIATDRAPSHAAILILGLGKKALRRSAAPLSALAAACLVYYGGTHLLGIQGGLALSKRAPSGPSVPDLGSLPKSADTNSGKQEKAEEPQKGASPATPKTLPMQTEQASMPEGLSWPGKGMIEVVTSEEELIYIDGVFTGRGPLRRIPVTPGKHDVAIKKGGETRSGTVTVEADKNTRAIFKTTLP